MVRIHGVIQIVWLDALGWVGWMRYLGQKVEDIGCEHDKMNGGEGEKERV